MSSIPHRALRRLRRLVEAPPVRERIVIKAAEPRDEHLDPGFIIGIYRSGTTLLRYVLDSHSRIAVPPESNFLVSLAGFSQDPWVRKGLSGIGVDDEGFIERLREFCWRPLDDYTIAKQKQRWFDKTPSYTNILPFLNQIFGQRCRYLMLYRHGLDVANSMAEGHANKVIFGPAKTYVTDAGVSPRVGYTRYWVDQCAKMQTFEAAHPGQCLRLRYEDFASDPQAHLPPIFAFIGEPWEPGVLEFHQQAHDFGLQDHKIAETRGFKPNIGGYRGWPNEDIDAAMQSAEATLKTLGYEV